MFNMIMWVLVKLKICDELTFQDSMGEVFKVYRRNDRCLFHWRCAISHRWSNFWYCLLFDKIRDEIAIIHFRFKGIRVVLRNPMGVKFSDGRYLYSAQYHHTYQYNSEMIKRDPRVGIWFMELHD